jgi:hypothetical protein
LLLDLVMMRRISELCLSAPALSCNFFLDSKVPEDEFVGSVLLKSLRLGHGSRIREFDGFHGRGFINVTIPASVSVIKSTGFPECRFLEAISFELPAQVTGIDGFAHSALCHLALPQSVSMIGSSRFNACQF